MIEQLKALEAGARLEYDGERIYTCTDTIDGAFGCITMHRGSDPRNGRGRGTWLAHELLSVVANELRAWQKTQFSCKENAVALTHCEEALLWMAARAERREREGKLGTQQPER